MTIRDGFFKSKTFVEAQLWVFNGFSAVSIAFYFSLFSAGNPENFPVSLQLAVVLFGISLATNGPLAFLILISDKDSEFLNMLNNSKYFGWVPITSIYSMAFAVISLIAFYSWWAFSFVFITLLAVVLLFFQAMRYDKIEREKRMRQLKSEQLNAMLDILSNKKKRD